MRSNGFIRAVTLTSALALQVWGCGGTGNPGNDCVPNAQVACVCGAGGTGTQVCNATGDGFSVCSCATSDAGPTACRNSAECQNGNPCTVGTCANDVCTYEPTAGSCDDGDACSSNDVCTAGVCRGTGSCAGLACATDALEEYLETATFCMPVEYARAALPSNVQPYVSCAGADACASGCPITITMRPPTSTFFPAQALGDQARMEASVEVESFTFTFTSGAGTTLCEHTGTMTVNSGEAVRLEIFHTLAMDMCPADASSSTASFFSQSTSRVFTTATRPGTGSTETQAGCNSALAFLRSYDSDWSSYHDLLLPAWAKWAQPRCRACTDGVCPDGLRCEMAAPPVGNP